jgi:hypothetical protein
MTRAALGIVMFALAVAGARVSLDGQTRTQIDPLTASISGRVTSETGAPLRRAEVRATSNGGLTRFTTTDTDGRYVVRDLPAGAFTLHISKSGFVPLYFGQRRPFERRLTLQLSPGIRLSADVRLPRAGAITGRIVDRTGEPVMGVRVQALRRRMVDGLRGLQATGAADTTDDQGSYRVYGLPPGEYYVAATPRRVEEITGRPVAGTLLGRGTPIFYPGTANRDEAQRVTVDVSGEARADLQLNEVRTSRVSGIVLQANGTPAAGAMLTLLSRDVSVGGGADSLDGLMPLQLQDDADDDGRFEIVGVPPGSFTLRAQTRTRVSVPFDPVNQRFTAPRDVPAVEMAMLPVSVDGDVAGLTVSTAPGGTVDIVLVADQGVSAPLPDNVRVTVRMGDRSELGLMTMSHSNGASNIDIRGSLQANALELLGPAGGGPAPGQGSLTLPAPARVSVEGLPENWAVKAVLLENEDVTDQLVMPRGNQPKTLRVVLTDRVTRLVGSVASGSFTDNGTSEAVVLVFPDDERKWAYPSRFVRSARAQKGRFEITGLPPNQEYRALAVDYLEDGEEYDTDFLKRVRARASRLSLREGDQIAIDLRIVQR